MIKAVLWDMDGTLVDSLGHHWTAWRDVAAAEGFDLSYDTFVSTLGKRNDEIALEWFGPGMPEQERTRVSLDKEALYREYVRAAGIEPLPGVMDWLTRLRKAGWKQAIATSAPRLNEEAVVEALGLAPWFDARVAAEDVARGKPFPDVFLTAAARLGVPPTHAIVVEDAVAGIQAGRAAGMKTIGVSPHGPLDGADLWVRSLTELPPDVFDALLGS